MSKSNDRKKALKEKEERKKAWMDRRDKEYAMKAMEAWKAMGEMVVLVDSVKEEDRGVGTMEISGRWMYPQYTPPEFRERIRGKLLIFTRQDEWWEMIVLPPGSPLLTTLERSASSTSPPGS